MLNSAGARGRVEGMNGAESLARAFTGAGVEVCFANPGTSPWPYSPNRVEGGFSEVSTPRSENP